MTGRHAPIARQIATLALPIVLGNLLHTSHQMVNTFWVGRLGADAVAAVSVAFPIIFLLVSLGSGLSIAGSILVAQYIGARQPAVAAQVGAQTLALVIGMSILIALAGWLATPVLLGVMGVSATVIHDATLYLRLSFTGVVFMFVFALYQALMRAVGETRQPLRIIFASVVMNVVLDPILIFGWGPVPACGVAGAAIATLLTQGISAAVAVHLMFRSQAPLPLRVQDLRPHRPLIARVFRLGMPASVEQSMQALGITAITILVASFGTLAVAAYGIGFRVLTFVIIPAFGISMAASTLVAQCMGAGDPRRAEHVTFVGTCLNVGLLGLLGLVFHFGATPIVRFFAPRDAALVEAGATVLGFMAMTFPLSGLQLGLSGTLRGAGDTFVVMLLSMIGTWLVQLPIAWSLAMHTALGETGIWLAYPLAGIVNSAILVWHFRRGRWKTLRLIDTPGEKQA